MFGMRRRTTLAMMTRNMTASKMAPMAVVTVSIVFWTFVSIGVRSSLSGTDGAGPESSSPLPPAGTNLRVEVIDALLERFPWGLKLTRVIVDVALIVYYAILTWSGYELATRARQAVSTMPQFTMGQVYMIFPVAGVLCIVGAVINLLVTLTVKEEGKEEKA